MTYSAVLFKHGEVGIQAILEDWERSIGLSYNKPTTLEERWSIFIDATNIWAKAA